MCRGGVTQRFGLVALALAVAVSCDRSPPGGEDHGVEAAWARRVQTFELNVDPARVDTTFYVRDHFIASVEMQLSGEPFATTMGRTLPDFSRDHLPSNLYFDPAIHGNARHGGRVDLVGFSTAVESYEYSKQSLNNVALESGAGVSELFGPVINPDRISGKAALEPMRALVQSLGRESNLAHRPLILAGKWGADVTRWWTDATPTNPFGWRGIWPVMLPFSSFDPHIVPTSSVSEHCSISSDDDPGRAGAIQSNDYECDYTQLHLPNRDKQVSGFIDPGSSGWHSWKAALWVLNYLQLMHDAAENPIERVPEGELVRVGAPGNAVKGTPSAGHPSVPGVFLGSSNIEGFQAAMFVEMVDNQVEEWLKNLTTTDGSTLSGFTSLLDATSYSTTSPLRWFPARVKVTESPDESGFSRPTGFSVASPDSELLDLAGMLGAYSSLYALTDHDNPAAGGSQPARAYFDGDPFADDDQRANGQATTHDRMLAIMRVLVVNIERMHRDPASGLLVDDVHMAGGSIARGTTLSADVAAYTLLALRTARRAVDSELRLYSNMTPDTHGIPTLLDSFPPLGSVVTASAAKTLTFGRELDSLITSLSESLYANFTRPDGTAYVGWNVVAGASTDGGVTLDAHSAAIRGLLVAYLATGDVKYRERALAVYRRLESVFYFSPARAYATVAGHAPKEITFTPRRFALLQGALRDVYELIAVNAGHEALASEVKDRVARLNKLVLNGWDDRNQDEQVQWPDECVRYVKDYTGPGSRGPEGHVLVFGGLEMAERSLTGETGSLADVPTLVPRRITTDREHDCVPEVSAVGLPAALASSITFTLTPSPGAWAVRTRQTLAEEKQSAAVGDTPASVFVGQAMAGESMPPATHSGPLVVSPDGSRLYVANPDADAVTAIDTGSGQVVRTFLLTGALPSVDPSTGHYWPAAEPRAVALDPAGTRLFVTGERSGHVYAFDTESGAKLADKAVCAEPIGVHH